MKATAQQQRESLNVVTVLNDLEVQSQPSSRSSLRFGRRGLHSVEPGKAERVSWRPGIFSLPKLSSFDVVRVNQVTIREGESHRIWPPSVLRRFNKAKVITETSVRHYELKDSNLIRVNP